MKIAKTAAVAALVLAAGALQLGMSSALAAPPDERELIQMIEKSGMTRADGMVTKQDFIKLMGQRFDAMDKQKKGMLSVKDVAKILDPNFAVN
jgi:arsenate reductase-like glutaredoxin family protein